MNAVNSEILRLCRKEKFEIMAGVKLTGDWQEFYKAIEKLGNTDFRGIHKELGEMMVSSTLRRFKREINPAGKKWKKSLRVKLFSGKTLSDTARLKRSIHYEADAKKVEVGTDVKYAAIHQFGGIIKAKSGGYLKFTIGGQFAQKKEVTIPQREFLGISEDDKQEAVQIIESRFRRLT